MRPTIGILVIASALSLSLFPAVRGQHVTRAAQAQTNAASFRNQIGPRLTFVCPANVSINQDIYGTDVYTDTSPICTAAAHAGLFNGSSEGGVVFLTCGASLFRAMDARGHHARVAPLFFSRLVAGRFDRDSSSANSGVRATPTDSLSVR